MAHIATEIKEIADIRIESLNTRPVNCKKIVRVGGVVMGLSENGLVLTNIYLHNKRLPRFFCATMDLVECMYRLRCISKESYDSFVDEYNTYKVKNSNKIEAGQLKSAAEHLGFKLTEAQKKKLSAIIEGA